jgi:hypothetical protein
MSAPTTTGNVSQVFWQPTPVDDSRRQSTTPANALNRLPNQRPVQLFTLDPSRYVGSDAIPLPKQAGRKFAQEPPTELQKRINYCARWAEADCSAFDDPMFAELCGICVAAGVDGTVGGLYVDPEERDQQFDMNNRPLLNAKPSFGSCPAGAFTMTKAQCADAKLRQKCVGKTTFDDPDCVASLHDPTMRYISASAPQLAPRLILGGHGIAVIGIDGTKQPLASGSLEAGISIPLTGHGEGTVLSIRVSEGTGIGGILQGTVRPSEPYSVDIAKLIYVDTVSGNAPRRYGFIGIKGSGSGSGAAATDRVFRMVPGVGKETMTLLLRIPMTFVQGESAPVVRTADSARQLGMVACSGAGSDPGNYSLSCLKYAWETNGCTRAGAGYPGDVKRATRLLWDSESHPRTLGQIHETLQDIASLAYSGTYTDGRQAPASTAEAARRMCIGPGAPAPPPAKKGGVVQTVVVPLDTGAHVQSAPTWTGLLDSAARAFRSMFSA